MKIYDAKRKMETKREKKDLNKIFRTGQYKTGQDRT